MSRILLVEDNEDDVELTLLAFSRSKLANEIVVARDGDRALQILHEQPDAKLPELVLLDLNLPGLSGTEVLERIREHTRTRLLPVVVMTSSAEERDRLATYSLGANSYIVKPVDFDRFMVAAQQIGMYWLMLNIPPPEERHNANPVH